MSNKPEILARLLLKSKTITLVFAHGSQLRISREYFLRIVFLAYHYGVFPVRSVGGKMVLSNGIEISTHNHDIFLDLLINRGWVEYDEYISKGRVRYLKSYGLPSIYEMFEQGVYDCSVEGKTVVDIGSSVGDSPIYFASKGARRVI
ncbi:MAG: hypothetical protein JRN20_23365, partial [Nitrososphaerota archaeon]|nr:hypothetical protein [Nitrososphaerota archaeon]